MKLNKLIGILLFFILSVYANALSVTSYGFTPSTITLGERTKIYLNLDAALPSNYDIRISGGSSGSGAIKLGGGQQRWYSYTTPSKAGSFRIYFHLFKNGSFAKYLNRNARLTVKSPTPTVSSVSFPTLKKDVRSSRITIYGSNLTSSTAFTIADATNCTTSYSSSTRVYAYCTPRASGTKQYLVKDRSGGTVLKRGYVTVKSPTPTVSSVSFPTLTKDVRSSRITIYGSNLTSSTAFTIADATNCTTSYSSSTRVYAYCTPRASGTKQYLVKDRSGGTVLKRGYVTVKSNIPTVTSTSVNPPSGYSGDNYRFTARLSGTLPSGYKAYINFDDSHNGWLGQNSPGGHVEMRCSGSSCSKDRVVNTTGNRMFRIGIFKGSTLVGSYSSAKSFKVSQKPEPQYAPTVSISSASSSTIQGKSYQIKLYFADKNSNLKNAFINWGDGTNNSTIELSGGSSTKYVTHTYSKAGNFTWRVVVNDHTGKSGDAQKSVRVEAKPVDNSVILKLLNKDSLIRKMDLANNLNSHLSRSDAIVMIDKMRILVKSGSEKNMEAYYNPFPDVPDDAEYLSSLVRLAYYHSKSFDVNPINKYNSLFNPMRHMTREEFLKVVMTAFDIPMHSYNLSSKFSDTSNMSDWAKKYFETAVYRGIIYGNNGKLLARDKISIQEALWILARIKEKFEGNYPFDPNSYDAPESLDVSKLYHKTIGFEYEPRYYKPNATPINITRINVSNKKVDDFGKKYYELSVESTMDRANGASDYYWWSTNYGYFKEEPSVNNYKKVRFYPMSSQPKNNYHITVNGGDNLGYVDSSSKEISAFSFSYPEHTKVASGINVDLSSINVDKALIVNKLFTVDLSNTSVKKTNIELSIDQVVVSMKVDGKTYELFHSTPTAKKARFIMGDFPDIYGKNVDLTIEVYSQDKKYTTTKRVKYLPQFTIRGKVYNSIEGTKVTAVVIGGKKVQLDENGEFYYTLDKTNEIHGLQIKTLENSSKNHFNPASVDLTYQDPSKYIVLTGEDARPMLNVMVTPIHVPSSRKVTFTLTANSTIPSNANISLENSSCNTPSGLGSKKVTIICTTANTNNIVYSMMKIVSPSVYSGEIVRTVVVDKALNNADEIDTVKNQLSVPNYTREDIFLPTSMLGVKISWSSNKPSVLSETGEVRQQFTEQHVKLIATLRKDGTSATKTFSVTVPAKDRAGVDTDGDGIPDYKDPDIDGDGVPNARDAFPKDKNEWLDTDNDGIGNNADKDDDNDGISDKDEIKWGFDPLDASDGGSADADGDGVSNKDEIEAGSDPLDPHDTKKPKKYAPIIVDDMIIMVPIKQ